MKLNDTQLILLSSASKRDDGLVVIPPRLKDSAAKAIKPLLKAKLLDVERDMDALVGIAGLCTSICGLGDAGCFLQAGVDFLEVSLDGGLGDCGVHGRSPG